jgi:hypothetical protein
LSEKDIVKVVIGILIENVALRMIYEKNNDERKGAARLRRTCPFGKE